MVFQDVLACFLSNFLFLKIMLDKMKFLLYNIRICVITNARRNLLERIFNGGYKNNV